MEGIIGPKLCGEIAVAESGGGGGSSSQTVFHGCISPLAMIQNNKLPTP